MFTNFQGLSDRIQHHHSERISFRPLVLADAGPLWQACQNPLFNQHLLWSKPETPEVVVDRVKLLLAEAAGGRLTAASAVLRDTGEWVALFRFFHEDERLQNGVETGIWTHPRFWAGGYSQELSRLAVKAAFAETSLEWLLAKTAEENRAAQGMIQSVGLTLVGREEVPTETGGMRQARVYRITRAEAAQLDLA